MTKTLTFGVLHMTVAFTVAYVLSGSVWIGGAIALVEPMVNTVAYFFHEKAWERIQAARQAAAAAGFASGREARAA